MTAVVYTDQGPGSSGTPLNAANLNTAVPSTAYLISGGLPGSVSASSLSIAQPATQAVVPLNPGVEYVTVASQTLVVPASPTGTYFVDITSTGTYTVTQALSPSLTALRLYSVLSSGTGLTTLTQLYTQKPVDQSLVVMDQTESPVNDPINSTGSIVNNLNRIRYQMGIIAGGVGAAWNTAVQMIPFSQKGTASGVASLDASTKVVQDPASKGLASGVASLNGSSQVVQEPASKGAASGIASLNGSSLVVQEPASKAQASGIASLNGSSQVVQDPASKALASGLASLNASSKVVQEPASKGLASGIASLDASGYLSQIVAKGVRQVATYVVTNDISCPDINAGTMLVADWRLWTTDVAVTLTNVQSGSSLLCFVMGQTFENQPPGGPANWVKFGVYGNSQTTVTYLCGSQNVAEGSAFSFAGAGVLTGLSGTVTVHQIMNTGGPGTFNYFEVKAATNGGGGRGDCLTFVVMEIA